MFYIKEHELLLFWYVISTLCVVWEIIYHWGEWSSDNGKVSKKMNKPVYLISVVFLVIIWAIASSRMFEILINKP